MTLVLSKVAMCVECERCKEELEKEGITLKVCKDCRIAQYCSKECQVKNFKIHKKPCRQRKNAPPISFGEMFTRVNKNRINLEPSFFSDYLKQILAKLQVGLQCKSYQEIERVFKATELVVWNTWEGGSFPNFRFLIPPLLLHLGRDDDAFNCIHYLIFDYGKDRGKSLGLEKSDEPSLVPFLQQQDKYQNIFDNPLMKDYKYIDELFSFYNPATYCGVLFLTLIGIKLNIIKVLKKQIEEGKKNRMGLCLQQQKSLLDCFLHMMGCFVHRPYVDKLLFDTPIVEDKRVKHQNLEFYLERANAFAEVARLKIMSDPEGAEHLHVLYNQITHIREELLGRNKER